MFLAATIIAILLRSLLKLPFTFDAKTNHSQQQRYKTGFYVDIPAFSQRQFIIRAIVCGTDFQHQRINNNIDQNKVKWTYITQNAVFSQILLMV
jgi:hypothetical protein